jgi:hypothetical protein
MNQKPLHDWLRTLGILVIAVSALIATLRYCGFILTEEEKQSLALIKQMQNGTLQKTSTPQPSETEQPKPPRAIPLNGN